MKSLFSLYVEDVRAGGSGEEGVESNLSSLLASPLVNWVGSGSLALSILGLKSTDSKSSRLVRQGLRLRGRAYNEWPRGRAPRDLSLPPAQRGLHVRV